MSEQKQELLLLDETNRPLMTQEDAEQLSSVLKRFMPSYLSNKDAVPVDEWLRQELARNFPKRPSHEITQMTDEILDTLSIAEEKSRSLQAAVRQGQSKEHWFAEETNKALSYMEIGMANRYLEELDDALKQANDSLAQTIKTQSGLVSQNPNLDGFIAEQYHAQTFNLNAQASGSPYRAEVLQPEGAYAKNSVDIVIKDSDGHIVKRYQSKYCQDSKRTMEAFQKGDYRGQQKLVPSDQLEEISQYTNATDVITAPDGISSRPLTKSEAKRFQEEAQSGNWNDLNWNEYAARDIALGLGRQVGQAAILGAAVGTGFNLAQKVWNGEEIDGGELLESALTSGADFGVKAALAGALKVGSEKGLISAIPKGTPVGALANVAFISVENLKVAGKVASGELTFQEGLDKMEQTTVAAASGIALSAKGASIGATIGTVLGPVGTAIGGFVGGTIGYMAGSKVGEIVVKGAQKIRNMIAKVTSTVERSLKTVANCLSVLSWFV